jgi:hypothetical protein
MTGKVAISAANVGNLASYTPVGLAPLNGNLNETDLVMQDTSGNLYFYDIQKDALGPSGRLMPASDSLNRSQKLSGPIPPRRCLSLDRQWPASTAAAAQPTDWTRPPSVPTPHSEPF